MIQPPALLNDSSNRFGRLIQRTKQVRVLENRGRVVQLTGLVIESEGPLASIGEVCRIDSTRDHSVTLAEVVGFRNHHLLLMPLGELHGLNSVSHAVSTSSHDSSVCSSASAAMFLTACR